MFNLFGKKGEINEGRLFTDKVYMTHEDKLRAICELATKDPNCIFIAWFPDTVAEFQSIFKENNLDTARIVEATRSQRHLPNCYPVFLEHYPLAEKEITYASTWNQQSLLVFSSMDEALFKHFGSEKMIPVMKMMGMKANEPIEHELVTKSIASSQEKIAAQTGGVDLGGHSQEAWLKNNLK